MRIILQESKYAKEMIAKHDMGDNPVSTLSVVAKYYFSQGCDRREVRRKLNEFLIRSDPDITLSSWAASVDRVVQYAQKHPIIDVPDVHVSQSELDVIGTVRKRPPQRLAFTLLCLAKYWNYVNPNNNDWVCTPPRDIVAMANIKTSVKYQSADFRVLADAGLIERTKKFNSTNLRVCFLDANEPVLTITDFRDLGNQYLMYRGGPYFICQNCGQCTRLKDPYNRRRQKYCLNCAKKLYMNNKVPERENLEAALRGSFRGFSELGDNIDTLAYS